MKKKEYTGSVYLGAVGSDAWEYPDARDSIGKVLRRQGDSEVQWHRGTKGYEARQLHFESWLGKTSHPFMFLMDGDEVYPANALERLRGHRLPYVTGYHLRRRWAPVAPLWFELGPRGAWPRMPWHTVPESGKLHPLGGSGWGCVLIHRDVAEAVRPLLKGEQFILEDDMDIWPYDLARVLEALRGLRTLTTERPALSTLRPALEHYVRALDEEIRPLRGMKDMVGSDVRFPFFAREAGYILMGDPDVKCDHIINYPLPPDDFAGQPDEARLDFVKYIVTETNRQRRAIRARLRELAE